jgi:transcriptional regulator GlxA family with amidase domain
MKSFSSTASALVVFLGIATAVSGAEPAPRPPKPATRNVAIVLYEGVELLDFAGPGEVFSAAANFGAVGGQPAFRVYTVATAKAPLTSQGFLRIVPDFTIEDAPRPDLIIIPGGDSGVLTKDARFMAWAQKAFAGAEVSLSVCTGAFVLGKAGLLDGRSATTWFGAVENLRQAVPRATVQDGRRFIDQGQVVTTAGVSAGIDGALHVVARLLGKDVAEKTAQYMEYRWSPEPYLVGSYAPNKTGPGDKSPPAQ